MKKQRRSWLRCWLSLSLILCVIVCSFPAYVAADTGGFQGLEDREVEENTQIDLLENVFAYGADQEPLDVTVTSVICNTDPNFGYDGSNFLIVGEAGTEYFVEYLAASPTDANISYTGSRKITSIQSTGSFTDEEMGLEVENENQEDISGDNIGEDTDENPEDIPEKEEEVFSDGSVEDFSDGNSVFGTEGNQIIYENGIHYIIDPAYPDKKITLFCMNNKRHWPHHTEEMGDVQVPGYTEGYLTPEDFKSQEDYDECMRRLSKLLYAGYPYNGERLYQIVADSSNYMPTVEEFNQMLIVPPILQTAFPYLGHHDFKYSDFTTNNEQHIEYLTKFISDTYKLNSSGGATVNGLTIADITAMPFFKAAFSFVDCFNHPDNTVEPLGNFQTIYGGHYFVTEEEAYNATQYAVWHLLFTYGIEDNDLASLDSHSELSKILFTYSERGGLLNYEPSSDQIEVLGDLEFTFNPKDGMWHSGTLRIREPDEYHGLYRLDLPEGITALCDNLNYVYGNEDYELVSNHQPTIGESFGIQAEFVWLQEFKQYSPMSDVVFDGKKFQNMIGAIIHNKTLQITKGIGAENVGNISITKKVVGETDNQNDFYFTLRLLQHEEINGVYGDLEFHKGVAEFTLKDGETKKATNLPAGVHFVVEEESLPGYQSGITNPTGEIPISDEIQVVVTNTKLPDLSLSKTVTGELGDKTKQFEFIITLKDKDGRPVNKTYDYVGSVEEGSGAEKPADGKIRFTKGEAKISLSHGQKITIYDLPYQASYSIVEREADQEHYVTTYNGKTEIPAGKLETDTSVEVVNNREFVPPTGIKENTGHGAGIGIALSLVAVFLLFLEGFFRRRRG